MSLNIASRILSLPGQCVKDAQHDLDEKTLTLTCYRDRRYQTFDPLAGTRVKVNRYIRRIVRDLPLCGLIAV